jgi:hypothetical protein
MAGSYPQSLTVGDFNGDGKADLAVANRDSNNVSVLLGTWVPPQSATSTTLVATPNPSTFGQPVTLTATVSPSAATGQVTFYDGATVMGVATLTGGTATFATSMLPSGSRSLQASYGGSAAYLSSRSASITQTVSVPNTTTTLVTAPNPSTFGQPVTLTATVSPSAAQGQVTFYDGNTVLNVVTLTSGTATFATSSLPAGNRSLRAYYMGDGAHQASISDWLTQTVTSTTPEFRYLGSMAQLASGHY